MSWLVDDPETQKLLRAMVEQNQQIMTLLNKILTALERQNGKSEGTFRQGERERGRGR